MTCLSFPMRAIRAVRKEADVPAIEEDIMETDLRSFIPVMGEYILFSLLALTLFFFFWVTLILVGYLQERKKLQ